MTETLMKFFNMGGYAFYVWSAYGSVLVFLMVQWFLPWKRWRNYLHQEKQRHEPHS